MLNSKREFFTACKKCKSGGGERGISLLFVVLIMSVILAIGFGVSGIFIQQTKMMEEVGYSVNSFYAADSGVEQQLYDLYKAAEDDHQAEYTGFFVENGASYEVRAVCGIDNTTCFVGIVPDANCTAVNYCIKSIGSYKKIKRAIEIKY